MNFKHIIGHKKNIERFKRMIERDRIPHALLFTGPEGAGKRMVAVAFAAVLNCNSPYPDGACGNCPSCIKLKAGTHPFIRFIGSPKTEKTMEVDFGGGLKVLINNLIPAGEDSRKKMTEKISIDQVREIIRESSLKPYGSDKKIFILDDIAVSSIEALNCLLKILEEPPPETYFILITSKEELLFPTIISRCQRFEFASLSDEEMEVFIREKLSTRIDEERKKELLDISFGLPGRLLQFLELKNIYFSGIQPETFFENVKKWFSDKSECLEKLKVMLELQGSKFRKEPTDEGYERIGVIEGTIKSIKKNANPELAVSNMFLKIGAVDL